MASKISDADSAVKAVRIRGAEAHMLSYSSTGSLGRFSTRSVSDSEYALKSLCGALNIEHFLIAPPSDNARQGSH